MLATAPGDEATLSLAAQVEQLSRGWAHTALLVSADHRSAVGQSKP